MTQQDPAAEPRTHIGRTTKARLDQSQERAKRATHHAERNELRAKQAEERGDAEKAAHYRALATKQQRSASKHDGRARKLSRRSDRLREGERWLSHHRHSHERAPDSPERVPTAKEINEQRRRERLYEQGERAKASSLLKIGLHYDQRTAAGERHLEVKSRGAVGYGGLADYSALIQSTKERTPARLAAMQRFDELCHTADKGLLPEPRFEPGVDVSSGPSGVPEARIAGLAEKERLAAHVGAIGMQILERRVYQRATLTAIVREGIADERAAPFLFLAAVDAVVAFYRIRAPQEH